MKPASLKPGDVILCDGRRMTFLRRYRQFVDISGPSENWFQCDDYRGLNGPKDDGRVRMSDSYVARHCQRAPTTLKGEPQP